MKLMCVGEPGAERPALYRGPGLAWDLSSVVSDFGTAFFAENGLGRLANALPSAAGSLPEINLADIRVGAPLSRPGKVTCIGLNYRAHAAEAGMKVPEEPVVFMKTAATVVGPNDDDFIPPGSFKTNHGLELAVVIGATDLPDAATALKHVAGFAISNDVSERGYHLEHGGQWDKGKNCETFNSFGPWIATPEEITDPQSLGLQLSVNGVLRQKSSTADMVFDVGHLVCYLSQFMVLEPGDVINTWTPQGVSSGMHPPSFLRDGGRRYAGAGVRAAVGHARHELFEAVSVLDATDQAVADAALEDVDGAEDLHRQGANAVLAVSLTTLLEAVDARDRPLYAVLTGELVPLLRRQWSTFSPVDCMPAVPLTFRTSSPFWPVPAVSPRQSSGPSGCANTPHGWSPGVARRRIWSHTKGAWRSNWTVDTPPPPITTRHQSPIRYVDTAHALFYAGIRFNEREVCHDHSVTTSSLEKSHPARRFRNGTDGHRTHRRIRRRARQQGITPMRHLCCRWNAMRRGA